MKAPTCEDISHIISAEFELTKGTVVSGRFPPTFDLSLENILIEKLIPDGLHNYQSDCFVFRNMVPINATSLQKRVDTLNSAHLPFRVVYFNDKKNQFDLDLENPENDFFALFPNKESTSFESTISIDKEFNLVFENELNYVPKKLSLIPPLEVVMNYESKILLSSESHNFMFCALGDTENSSWLFRELLLFADPTSKKILKAISEGRKTEERLYLDLNFFTLVSNKKEKNAQRGAIYRSITICSETLRDLSPFREFLEQIMEEYMQLPPNDPHIQEILERSYQSRPKLSPKQRIPKLHSFYNFDFLKSNTQSPNLISRKP
jgi:hypothetical protein